MIFCQHFLEKKKPACLQASFDCQRSCAGRLCDFVTLFSSQISPDDCIGGMKYMRFSDNGRYSQQSIGNILHNFIPNSNAVLYLRMKTLELSDQMLGLGTFQVSVVDYFILLNKATGVTGWKQRNKDIERKKVINSSFLLKTVIIFSSLTPPFTGFWHYVQ